MFNKLQGYYMSLLIFIMLLSHLAYANFDFNINPIYWKSSLSNYYIFNDSTHFRVPITIKLLSSEPPPYYYFLTFSSNKTTDFFDSNLNELNQEKLLHETVTLFPNRFAEFNGHQLEYQFYETRTSSIPLSEQISSDYSMIRKFITINDSISLSGTFYMEVFPNQKVPAGTYTDLVIVSLYKSSTKFFSDATLISRKKIPVSISVLGISEFSIFHLDNPILFNELDLANPDLRSIQYKIESNTPGISLWLESNEGTLSRSGDTVIYHPKANHIPPQTNSLLISHDPNKSLNLLNILIDSTFYDPNFFSTANTTIKTIFDPTQNITKQVVSDNGGSKSSNNLVPTFNDTLRFIIKVD